jgi:hypothetical protein
MVSMWKYSILNHFDHDTQHRKHRLWFHHDCASFASPKVTNGCCCIKCSCVNQLRLMLKDLLIIADKYEVQTKWGTSNTDVERWVLKHYAFSVPTSTSQLLESHSQIGTLNCGVASSPHWARIGAGPVGVDPVDSGVQTVMFRVTLWLVIPNYSFPLLEYNSFKRSRCYDVGNTDKLGSIQCRFTYALIYCFTCLIETDWSHFIGLVRTWKFKVWSFHVIKIVHTMYFVDCDCDRLLIQ